MKTSNKTSILFFIIFSSFFLQHCSDPIATDTDRIYRGKFTDYINVIDYSDTVNIAFEQKKVEYNQNELIPFRVNETNKDSLIKLNLFGHYESYSENPKTEKEIENLADTIIIRYYFHNRYDKLSKTKNSIYIQNNSAPILEYVKIDSIIVEKDSNKVLNLKSRFMY